jgi:cytochrome c553
MKRAAIAAVVVAALAAGVVLSGIISVKASSGHLPPTAWVLDLAKRRSVAMRARTIEAPALDDPSLVRLGAAHFEAGCRPCHGAPGSGPPLVPSRMTPHPPDLAAQVRRWRPRELFYLVAHGVKFTGMPAWPAASRTDEAWAVVAFLQRLPGLDAAGYLELAGGRAAADTDVAARCVTCHHDAASALVPRLRGQSVAYLAAALDAYADRQRHSGVMQPIASALESPARRREIAERMGGGEPDPDVATRPAVTSRLITHGEPARDVPPCQQCHGPTPRTRDPRYPALAGQPAAYLRLQLTLFAEGRRGGSSYGEIMRAVAVRLTPAQMDDAAAAYAAMAGGS